MKTYPKIQHWNKGEFGSHCIAFNKKDGSNLRFEYSKKRGWYKFGTRRVMIDINTPLYGNGVDIFLNTMADELEHIFKKEKEFRNSDKFVVFGEFLGESSFAGQHEEDEEKELVLFDVNQYKKGLISPKLFVEYFSNFNIPEIIYEGIYDRNFVEWIKNHNDLEEGVVCKGVLNKQVWMSKIKTHAWLQKVKEKHGQSALEEEFNYDRELLSGY